jgi:saccharopine dehydrogenase (NAD+, L-lysine-forming)
LAVSAGLRPIVAGRRVEALRPLAERYGLEMRIGALEPTELDRVVDGSRVLVSCVAPYTIHGRPLVDAALRHGTHYVDCTGEPRFVEQLIRSDRAAREAGCALIPSAGLGLVANLVARAAAARVERVDRLTVDYKITGMRPSWGTANSTVHLLAGGAPAVRRGKVSYRLPGSRLRRLPDGFGALFPLTDTLTLAWQWPDAEVSSYLRSRVAPLLCAGLALGSTAARRRVVHSMVERAAGRFRDPDRGTPHGHFLVTVAASQRDGKSAVARARLDNVYELTSQAVLELVLTLLADDRHTGFCASGQVIGEPAEVAKRIGVDLLEPIRG